MDKILIGWCLRLRNKWPAVIPLADQYPRRGDGRLIRAPIGRRDAMALSATLAPVTTTGTAARTGAGAGSSGQKSVPSTCPTGESPTVFHG